MILTEYLIKFVPRKDKFKLSKSSGKGNGGGDHEEYEKGHTDNGNGSSSDIRPEQAKPSATNKGKEVVPDKRKASKLNSMVLTSTKKNRSEVRLIFVDINIVGQQRNALVDTRASNLFTSKKVAKKLGLSIKKLNNKIKILVKDVSYESNIDSIEWNVTKAPLEMLVEHETDMKPVEISVELPPMGKPSCENQEGSDQGKLECGQVRAIASCQRDVPTSGTNRAKRQQKPKWPNDADMESGWLGPKLFGDRSGGSVEIRMRAGVDLD
ncbi:hypothetical protein J1N35_038372 [Gossypium stocksii]|uniref:Uncharacterized protein n=1 Tax=Gossypium stocksii TaxID=47602 RepID=A0A9D3ULZ4_9ROSI|nr:hypothetical protein J1N35_038372 [Gossypium stocksii]